MKRLASLSARILSAALLTLPALASAQVKITAPTSVQHLSSLQVIIKRVFDIAIGVSGIIFVGMLLFGGVLYLTSLGVEDATTRARKTMINAAIGLAIVVGSWAIGNYVLGLFGIQVSL